MAGPYRQEGRVAHLATPLGPDELVLSRFDATEGLSELFEFRVEALRSAESGGPDLDFDSAIGQHCTITVNTADGRQRYFDGILTETQWLGMRTDAFVYRLVLRPWLWLMSFRSDCAIFHEMTAPDIIAKVFGRHGFAKFDKRLSKSYPTLEYCVQYRESDMAFVRRLMEQHGIAFYFRHEDGQHTLVMADASSSYDPIPGGTRSYIAVERQSHRDKEYFHRWMPARRFTSGAVMLKDYNFETPAAEMKADKSGDAKYENGTLEVYDYPGKYLKQADGKTYAQARLDMHRGADGHFLAEGDCVGCAPGLHVTLANHPDSAQNKEYLALRCSHTFVAEEYRSGGGAGEGDFYEGRYEFIRSDKPYAPPLVTEKPFVHGPQTALVIGEGEIDVDKYGRILVRFFWDRQSDRSMRCRLAQVWSGKNWGGVYIPRVGMEVIVQFLEGDPDHPLVIGTVYNAQNMPPYTLPDQKYLAGVKSQSTPKAAASEAPASSSSSSASSSPPGGGGRGYNEFVLDDTMGSELVRLHAERDQEVKIKHDERRKVGNDRQSEIGQNDTLDVGDKLHITAGTEIVLTTGMSKITMKKDGTIRIEGRDITVKAAGQLTTKGIIVNHSADATMTIKGGIVEIN